MDNTSISYKNIPVDILRHIYTYIGDVDTKEGMCAVMRSSCVCRSWREVVLVDELRRRYILRTMARCLDMYKRGAEKLEKMTDMYEETIVRINTVSPKIVSLQDIEKCVYECSSMSRVAKLAPHAHFLPEYGIDPADMLLTARGANTQARDHGVFRGIKAFKNTYKAKIDEYIKKLPNGDDIMYYL